MSTSDPEHVLEDIAVRDTRVSDAIDEPMRAMTLDILADETLTASEVHSRLADRGIDRTENTVRHHINELRDAGLDLTLPDEPTRCSRCNGELEGTAEADPLPEYVPDDPPSPVWRCPDCGHHYWRGSHWEDVRETLAAVE